MLTVGTYGNSIHSDRYCHVDDDDQIFRFSTTYFANHLQEREGNLIQKILKKTVTDVDVTSLFNI